MSKNAYKVDGDFQMGRIRQHFALEVVGADEDAAMEATYTDLGSRHSAKRRDVTISTVTLIPKDQADPITQKRL